jgi:hypothetical protein
MSACGLLAMKLTVLLPCSWFTDGIVNGPEQGTTIPTPNYGF